MSLRRHIDVLREFVSYGTPCEDWSALSPIGYVDREPSPGQRWLAARGIDTRDHGDDIRRATPEYQEGHRESQRRYASTAKGKATKKARSRSRRSPVVVGMPEALTLPARGRASATRPSTRRNARKSARRMVDRWKPIIRDALAMVGHSEADVSFSTKEWAVLAHEMRRIMAEDARAV